MIGTCRISGCRFSTSIDPILIFEGFAGTIASGIIRQGEEIMVLPSRQRSRVKEIVTFDGAVEEAFTPLSVTVTLEDEIDASRGDMMVRPGNLPQSRERIEAMLVWMSPEALVPGKPICSNTPARQFQEPSIPQVSRRREHAASQSRSTTWSQRNWSSQYLVDRTHSL